MFAKVLYPTDFSDVSKKALQYIRQLRQGGAETVVVLHVVDRKGIEAMEQYATGDYLELERKIMDDVRMEMNAVAAELERAGLKVETRIQTGVPVLEILKAEGEDVSLIVIGSHGKSNLEEIFLGSVSEKVVRKSKRPVLVVKR